MTAEQPSQDVPVSTDRVSGGESRENALNCLEVGYAQWLIQTLWRVLGTYARTDVKGLSPAAVGKDPFRSGCEDLPSRYSR